jgi:hypothetical protein
MAAFKARLFQMFHCLRPCLYLLPQSPLLLVMLFMPSVVYGVPIATEKKTTILAYCRSNKELVDGKENLAGSNRNRVSGGIHLGSDCITSPFLAVKLNFFRNRKMGFSIQCHENMATSVTSGRDTPCDRNTDASGRTI